MKFKFSSLNIYFKQKVLIASPATAPSKPKSTAPVSSPTSPPPKKAQQQTTNSHGRSLTRTKVKEIKNVA